jgi:RNA polymerase sigma factor (sigma-70 family)
METGPTSAVLRSLRRAVLPPDGAGLTDGQLLSCYLSQREEAAFAALVRRHGPMVWAVCRRVLADHHDAEDAFQAAFLVLVLKGSAVVPRERVGGWLHGVAYRTALKARGRAARRRVRERRLDEAPEPTAGPPDPGREVRGVLDDELGRLPEKYRAALVCCELEGQSYREAAGRLGCSEGTLSAWLTRGRALLAKRLARRGLAPAALAAALAGQAASAAPEAAVAAVVRAAGLGARAAAAGFSANVAALTKGGLKPMGLSKLQITAAALLAAGTLFAGAVGLAPPQAGHARPSAGRAAAPKADDREKERPRTPRAWKERLAVEAGRGEQIFAAAVSSDGALVAAGLTSGPRLIDATNGKVLFALAGGVTFAVAFSPDDKLLAAGQETAVTLFEVATGRPRVILKGHTKTVSAVRFAPDGKTLASASDTVRLWDAARGELIRQLDSSGPRDNGVYSLAFSPDGKRLVSAEGSDKTAILWDAETGKELLTFKGHDAFVVAVAYSPDGKTIASGSSDGKVKLWEASTGKELATFACETHGFGSLAFSPDGAVLASAGGLKKTVPLWDVAAGKRLAVLDAHTRIVWAVAFSRDGKTLVTAGDDAVRLWEEKTDRK